MAVERKERDLVVPADGRRRLHERVGGIAVAVHPVVRILGTRAHERLVLTTEFLPVAREDEDAVRDRESVARMAPVRLVHAPPALLRRRQAVVVRRPRLALHVARGETHEERRFAEIRFDHVRVERVVLRVGTEIEELRLRPLFEVLRHAVPHVAYVEVAVALRLDLVESAEVEVVFAARLVPEADVERVERARVREQPALAEMDAVRREEAPESAMHADALVPFVRRTGGILVLEHHEVVPTAAAERTVVQDAVVVLRALEFDKSEGRLLPREPAVTALGVANPDAKRRKTLLALLRRKPHRPAEVVHPEKCALLVTVGHDAVVVASVALPRLVVRHRDARVLRLMHDLRRGRLLRIHHVVVPQHLEAVPHVDRCLHLAQSQGRAHGLGVGAPHLHHAPVVRMASVNGVLAVVLFKVVLGHPEQPFPRVWILALQLLEYRVRLRDAGRGTPYGSSTGRGEDDRHVGTRRVEATDERLVPRLQLAWGMQHVAEGIDDVAGRVNVGEHVADFRL